jgi:hypothetical protein
MAKDKKGNIVNPHIKKKTQHNLTDNSNLRTDEEGVKKLKNKKV